MGHIDLFEGGNCGFVLAKHRAAEEIAGQFNVGRNCGGLALDGDVFQNQIDLVLDPREIAFDFFLRLLTTTQVGEAVCAKLA